MIEGVRITPLRQIPDERGTVMHMLRADAPHFEGFGEIYFSWVYPGAIKAWHVWREGKTLQTLSWRAEGRRAEPFPEAN